MALASPKYPFKQAVVFGAPDDPGVYALYFGDHLLFIGIARGRTHVETIRSQLLAHLAGELKPAFASHFKWEITRDPESRVAQLLGFLKPNLPPYNAPPA